MTFKSDLEKGEELEKVVIDKLAEDFHLIKNPDVKWVDLLIITDWIEVKFDDMSNKTWNYFLEIECNGKRSGVYKNEKIAVKYWAHSDGTKLLLISMKFLIRWVHKRMEECYSNKSKTSRWARIIESWGDGWRVKGLLVPKEELENIAYKIINI